MQTCNDAILAVLLPEYRRKVLGLLFLKPSEGFHVREIARLTATSTGTLTRELAKLSKAGLVTRTEKGRQVEYMANQESPIYAELASIIRKTSGLIDHLAAALAPLADKLEVAFVYGSMASGKARPGSDIDLLVIGNDVTFSEVVSALYPAQELLGRELNPKLYSRHEWKMLREKNSTFVRDVLTKPKLFVMGGENELG